MSKNLEKEYKALVSSEVPDLWSRIEAGLDSKDSSGTDSKMNNNVYGFPEMVQHKANQNSSRKHTYYKVWGTIAAACLCAAVAMPVMLRGTLSSRSKMDMSASPEFAGESMRSSTTTQGTHVDGMGTKNADNAMLDEGFNNDMVVEAEAATDCAVMEEAFAETGEMYSFAATVEILEIDVTRDSGPVYTAKILETENMDLEKDSEIKIYAPAYSDSDALFEKFQTYDIILCEKEAENEVIYWIAD